jgi:hypothetical protein
MKIVKIAKIIFGAITLVCLLLLLMVSGEQSFGKALLGLISITLVMLVSAFSYQFIALNEHKFSKSNKKGSIK